MFSGADSLGNIDTGPYEKHLVKLFEKGQGVQEMSLKDISFF